MTVWVRRDASPADPPNAEQRLTSRPRHIHHGTHLYPNHRHLRLDPPSRHITTHRRVRRGVYPSHPHPDQRPPLATPAALAGTARRSLRRDATPLERAVSVRCGPPRRDDGYGDPGAERGRAVLGIRSAHRCGFGERGTRGIIPVNQSAWLRRRPEEEQRRRVRAGRSGTGCGAEHGKADAGCDKGICGRCAPERADAARQVSSRRDTVSGLG